MSTLSLPGLRAPAIKGLVLLYILARPGPRTMSSTISEVRVTLLVTGAHLLTHYCVYCPCHQAAPHTQALVVVSPVGVGSLRVVNVCWAIVVTPPETAQNQNTYL